MLTLTVLGCDGSHAGAGGAASGYLVRSWSTGTAVWLDAGPGTFANLQRFCDPAALDAIVLSHEHTDHWSDLAGFVSAARWTFGWARDPVPVLAPPGVEARLGKASDGILAWQTVGDGEGRDVGGLRLRFSRTDHGPVTLAVRLEGATTALGYSADSGPGWSLGALGTGLDLALCEATYTKDHEGTAQHMSGRQAGSTAKAARARRLVVTHRWPSIPRRRPAGRGGRGLRGPGGPGRRRPRVLPVSPATDPRALRKDGRGVEDLRPVSFVRDFTEFAPGSVLVAMGKTKVLCTASIEERVPPWMRGSGKGWVTAEYSLLPGSSAERIGREAAKGKQSGRTQEIQRLIGRSLRAVTDVVAMGELQVTVDCDVLQADGGTRTASICGAYVALHDCFTRLMQKGQLSAQPLSDACAAVSVGVVDAACLLDLDYSEDSRAEVDMNVVMTGSGRFIEVQGTAEGVALLARRARRAPGAGRARDRHPARRATGRAGRGPDAAVTAGAVTGGTNGRRSAAAGPEALRLVLATANPDKAREIVAIMTETAGGAIELRPRPADVAEVEETGETLEENARLKAATVVEATGLPAIADDTGLEVDALGGAPGVYSARFAGEHASYDDNVDKLLSELAAAGATGAGARRARFRTVAIACFPDRADIVAHGVVEGVIAEERRGGGGFGYDPVFVPDGADGRSYAEMSLAEKSALSHRGKAFRALAAGLLRQ